MASKKCDTISRNINNLRYADDTTLMAESKEELKSFLMKVKEKSEKADLKLSSGHRSGKGQFAFQLQRMAMPRMSKPLHNCTHCTF